MIDVQSIELSINLFEKWLNKFGNYSYDNSDIISSPLGRKIKSFWLKHKLIGAPAMTFLHFSDIFCPSLFKIFSEKKRHEISDAHLAMGFIELYKYYEEKKYLIKSKQHIDYLIDNISTTEHGKGWGQPWEWVTPSGIVPSKNPVITNTAYCFDAIDKFSNIDNHKFYNQIMRDVSEFAKLELVGDKISDDQEDAIYGYNFSAKAYNAIAYRASLLLRSNDLFKNDTYKKAALKNLNYIIANQNDDGSWFYSQTSYYIDNIHTCFVLKNLIKAYHMFQSDKIINSINKGYSFYINNFIRKKGTLKHFAKIRYPKFRKIELYDYAEAINLEIEMNSLRKTKLDLLESLADQVVNSYQTKKGYFLTRINSFNMKNKIPYLGWPQAQLFHSLGKLLNHIK